MQKLQPKRRQNRFPLEMSVRDPHHEAASRKQGRMESFGEVATLSSGGETVCVELLTPERVRRGTEVVQARELRGGKCQKCADER